MAVRLARAKGRAEAMEEWLFANQPQITPDLVQAGGAQRRRGHRLRRPVRQDARAGEEPTSPWAPRCKVHGTPTFFINGVRIPIVKPEFFDAAIAYELKH